MNKRQKKKARKKRLEEILFVLSFRCRVPTGDCSGPPDDLELLIYDVPDYVQIAPAKSSVHKSLCECEGPCDWDCD